ncbi:MAG: family metallopeptidase [Burkholderiaceae bacterium]|nr:family metallopeptidase [Burkholderiaceae bacterium]
MDILQKASQFFQHASLKTRIIAAAGLLFAFTTFGAIAVAPLTQDASELPKTVVKLDLDLPDLSEQIASLEDQTLAQNFVREEKVRLGDTIGTLLSRLGVNDNAAIAFIKSNATANALLKLKAGQVMQATVAANGELLRLATTAADSGDNLKNIVVTREEQGFSAVDGSVALEKRVEMRSGVIQSSLFAATDAARIPDPVTGKFVEMFSTNVDFRADLRKGDRFNIVYETFWQNGSYIRPGRILAAEFVNGGKAYQAIWFDAPGNKGGYYTFDGKALKKAFLKSPVAFTRVSSGFSMRVHPVTGNWKQHKGIDFAAPTGTPIKAAADGVVESAKYSGGYGNLIVLKHWGQYSTAYGHLSRFASSLRKGQKVSQGDIIGYVGTTGMSTGPHLHYEFRVANVQRNPMSIDMPNTQPLTTAELQKFRAVKEDMLHRFALLNPALKTAAK